MCHPRPVVSFLPLATALQKRLAAAIMAVMAKKIAQESQTPAAVNKKAYHDYELVEKYEAGIELQGSEVKSLRAAAADLTGSHARMQEGECWLVGAKIAPYQQAVGHCHSGLSHFSAIDQTPPTS